MPTNTKQQLYIKPTGFLVEKFAQKMSSIFLRQCSILLLELKKKSWPLYFIAF